MVLESGIYQGTAPSIFLASTRIQRACSKRAFDVAGVVPTVNDPRVRFVKGWFQDSLPQFIKQYGDLFHAARNGEYTVIVHFDSDPYSSTLYLMTGLHWLLNEYFFIFDEFRGDESRALHDYPQAYAPAIEYFGRTQVGAYPSQVTGTFRRARYEPRRLRGKSSELRCAWHWLGHHDELGEECSTSTFIRSRRTLWGSGAAPKLKTPAHGRRRAFI